MYNENAHVLTESQFKEALIKGCIASGYLPEGRLYNDFEVTLVANGAVITFGDSEDISQQPEVLHVIAKPDASEVSASAGPNPPSTDEGPAPEELKGLLVQVMDRCPSVATIRAWGPDQKAKAKSWVKKCLKAKKAEPPIPLPERPAFIVEPQPRKRGEKVEPIARQGDVVESMTPAPNSSAVSSSRRKAFFDDADAEEAHQTPDEAD